MNTPSFQKTKRIIIISLAGCLFTIGLYGYLFHYLGSLNGEIADLKSKVAGIKMAESDRLMAEKILQGTAESRSRIEGFFLGADQIEEVNLVDLIKGLASSTAKVKLDITSLRRGEVAGLKNNKVQYLTIQANAQGGFSNVYYLLTLLEFFPKGLMVSGVELESIPGDPKKPHEWRMSFVLNVLKAK